MGRDPGPPSAPRLATCFPAQGCPREGRPRTPGPGQPDPRTPPGAPLFTQGTDCTGAAPDAHTPASPQRPGATEPQATGRGSGGGCRAAPQPGPWRRGPPGPSSVDHVSSGFKGKPDEKALSRLWQVSLSPLLSCESPDVSGSPLGASGGAGPGAGGAGSRTPLHGREPSCRPGSPDPPPCNKPTLTARHPGRAAGPGGGALAPRELH